MGMKLELLEDLLFLKMAKLRSAEQQQSGLFPKLLRSAQAPELKQALERHQQETERQLNRLQELLQGREQGSGGDSQGIRGIIADCEDLLGMEMDPEIRDAAIISSVAAAENFEIGCYADVFLLAQQIGNRPVADALECSLREEKAMADKLAALSQALTPEAVAMEQGGR